MQIGKDSVVTFHYRLRNAAGVELEHSYDSEPLRYLHGYDGIVPGLEAALGGKSAGTTFSITLSPEQGYGVRRDNAVQRVQKKHVVTRGKLTPGQVIAVNTEHGPRQVQVVKAGHSVVDVDTNHPLAGETLSFDIEILEVRVASDEERAHGHVHGPGGHHHE